LQKYFYFYPLSMKITMTLKEEKIAQLKRKMEEFVKNQAQIDEQLIIDYLAQNQYQAEKTLEGLYYVQTQPGTGEKAMPQSKVLVHYTGKTLDGKVFDSSVPRKQPFGFVLGTGSVIEGWDKGIVLMQKGEKGILLIPSAMGYGASGIPRVIPPNAVLVFEVELL
jgi:FKBP-type peptidyl-prolyl cis-trans isomerase